MHRGDHHHPTLMMYYDAKKGEAISLPLGQGNTKKLTEGKYNNAKSTVLSIASPF